jgi:hypothetical protein
LGTPLQAAPCDIVTAWPGTSVEHNLAAAESFKDVINDFAVIQMVAPVWEHTLIISSRWDSVIDITSQVDCPFEMRRLPPSVSNNMQTN